MPLSLDGTTGISATGNIVGNNISANTLSVTTFAPASVSSVGNVTGGNLITAGIVTATGNIQGGNLRTVGLVSATGSITTAGDVSITGNIVDGAALTIITSSNGNITMAPNGTGVVVVNTDIRNGQASGTGNIGASGATFNTIFARATSAQYADLAEMYETDKLLDAGQVVEFGGTKEIQQTTTSHSTRVAGIVSSNPSYLMNSALQAEFKAPVALTGRVPCYVVGTIKKGDRLVSSDQRGVATVLDPVKYEPGCIIGKALQDYDSQEIGRIEVAVGRF
jgi:trimeric autotransporter adhesin